VDVVHFDSAVDTRPYPTNLYEWLASKKCDADFVVHGVIARGPSSLMRDEKAVFTEFEVDVADTLYIKPGHRPRVPVVIIKRGGSVKLPEGLVTTVIDQLSDLHLRREYVLFLRAPKNPNGRLSSGRNSTAGRFADRRRPCLPSGRWTRVAPPAMAKAGVDLDILALSRRLVLPSDKYLREQPLEPLEHLLYLAKLTGSMQDRSMQAQGGTISTYLPFDLLSRQVEAIAVQYEHVRDRRARRDSHQI
jgi:hypothetical protein